MSAEIFLFPETVEVNPSSIISGATQISSSPIETPGYRLMVCYERLDKIDQDFIVFAVPSETGSARFFKYVFNDTIPDFEAHGFTLKKGTDGTIVSLSVLPDGLKTMPSKRAYENYGTYHEIAAYYHLDLVQYLSPSLLKDGNALVDLRKRFRECYKTPLSLDGMFSEINQMLSFFGFIKEPIRSKDYAFGSFKDGFSRFYKQYFNSIFFTDCCVTVLGYKQLKALFELVKYCLSVKYGLSSQSLISSLQRFQEESKMAITNYCDEETLKLLISSVIIRNNDPVGTMRAGNVRIRQAPIADSEFIGELPQTHGDVVQEAIRTGLNSIMTEVKSPGFIIKEIETESLSKLNQVSGAIKKVYDSNSQVAAKLASMDRMTADMEKESAKISKVISNISKDFERISNAYEASRTRLQRLKEQLSTEQKRTSVLLFLFIVFLSIAITVNIPNHIFGG